VVRKIKEHFICGAFLRNYITGSLRETTSVTLPREPLGGDGLSEEDKSVIEMCELHQQELPEILQRRISSVSIN
jgi:hypothetical protein